MSEERADGYHDIWPADVGHAITRGSDPARERRIGWDLFHSTLDDRYQMGWRHTSDGIGTLRRGFALVDPDTGEVIPVFDYQPISSSSCRPTCSVQAASR